MKKLTKILAVLLLLSVIVGCLAACDIAGIFGGNDGGNTDGPGEFIDYAETVKFDENSGRNWTEATVKLFVDGDTTHFNVSKDVTSTGTLKARYLAINTPESTGQIEPWGKKASNYTRTQLSAATDIILESDNAKWNLDSTGDRYLVWVWYKTAEMTEYRNLNLEIIQQGLAFASNASDNCYGEVCSNAVSQALDHKLHVHSKEKDPDFYYGSAKAVTLKELKTHIADYAGVTVSFEGVVAKNFDNTVYIEEYDEETGLYFGMQVYYGYSLNSFGKGILTIGNRVRIVGKVGEFPADSGLYQVSDIKYFPMEPDDERNIQQLGTGYSAAYQILTAKQITSEKVSVEMLTVDENGEEKIEMKEFDIGFLVMDSTAILKGLTIKSIYTTDKEDSASKGAMSITCTDASGNEIVVRTTVLREADGTLITEAAFPIGSVIDVKGLVDCYEGSYQLQLASMDDVTFVPQS